MFDRIKKSLFLQVVIALILGLIVGTVLPEQAQSIKPLGDLFIRFIQLLIAPIVFCVVVNGISGVGNIKKVGTIGVKTIFYFECVTTVALGLGLLLGLNSNIGVGMNIDPSSLDASAISTYTERAQNINQAGGISFLMNLVPTTVAGAFAKGDILVTIVGTLGTSTKNYNQLIGQLTTLVAALQKETNATEAYANSISSTNTQLSAIQKLISDVINKNLQLRQELSQWKRIHKQVKVDVDKGVKECPNCHAENPIDANYCRKCTTSFWECTPNK